MKKKSTDDLMRDLACAPSFDAYSRRNTASFSDSRVAELLSQIYEKKSITKAALARQAGISEVYLHQVFSGRRMPSRDRLLCICIALELSLEETQDLLKRASYAQLYPRIQRDAIISYGILHHMDLEEINQTLFAENEKTLS